MRLSDAMEAGYAKVGKQCFGVYMRDASGVQAILNKDAVSCCATGAVILAGHNPRSLVSENTLDYVVRLNDHCKMPIPEIVETLRGMNL